MKDAAYQHACQHCGIRNTRPVRVRPVREPDAAPIVVWLCGRCTTNPQRHVRWRPVAA